MEDTGYSTIVDILENIDILFKQIPVNAGKKFDEFRTVISDEYFTQINNILGDFENCEGSAIMQENLESFYNSVRTRLSRLLEFKKVINKIKSNESAVFKGELNEWE